MAIDKNWIPYWGQITLLFSLHRAISDSKTSDVSETDFSFSQLIIYELQENLTPPTNIYACKMKWTLPEFRRIHV
jgi:hypothetical protein